MTALFYFNLIAQLQREQQRQKIRPFRGRGRSRISHGILLSIYSKSSSNNQLIYPEKRSWRLLHAHANEKKPEFPLIFKQSLAFLSLRIWIEATNMSMGKKIERCRESDQPTSFAHASLNRLNMNLVSESIVIFTFSPSKNQFTTGVKSRFSPLSTFDI